MGGYSAIPQTRDCFFIFALQIRRLHIFIGILKKTKRRITTDNKKKRFTVI